MPSLPTATTRATATRRDRVVTRPPRRELDGILLLDKPLGLSSNQALQQVRRLFQAEKAGHTGSLDPLATGMLPICFGEATKLSGLLLDSDKCYFAQVRLGEQTSTGDAEGEVVATSCTGGIRLEDFQAVRSRFVGPILQVPPMYSALKHQGRRLYELARSGEEVERAPREVVIHELELISLIGDELALSVRCSKGTYIRTLAEDLAAAAGQSAHLRALRRTQVSPFGGSKMWTLEDLHALVATGLAALDTALLPLAAALEGWPQVRLAAASKARLLRGQTVECPEAASLCIGAGVAVLDENGRLFAVGELGADGRLASRRWVGGQNSA